MIACPLCGGENLEGADPCEHCGQPMVAPAEPDERGDIERQILADPLSALAPRPAPMVTPESTVSSVLDRLAAESCGCVVIAEDGRAIGIFSERDVVTRLDPDDAGARARPVRDLMSPNPETLDETAPVAFALQRMAGGDYRHIPVTRGERVVGLISARDLLDYICEHGTERPG